MVIAVALKLVHWGYYVPEWNYRDSQGPWGRAIGQWVPRRWTLYTFHDWPADLAFFMKRPVRQLRSPQYLEYQAGPASKFVLLQALGIRELAQIRPADHAWSRSSSINRADERVLARTAGPVPPPLGPNPSATIQPSRGRTSSCRPRHSHADDDVRHLSGFRSLRENVASRRNEKLVPNTRHFIRTIRRKL